MHTTHVPCESSRAAAPSAGADRFAGEPAAADPHDGRLPAAVEQALAWIELHLYEPISLGDLAAAVGLSRYHFHRLFRAATRLTPRSYLMQRRIAEAQRLMSTGMRSVEAAYLLQFADQSHFTRRFKGHVGLTPRRYAERAANPQRAS